MKRHQKICKTFKVTEDSKNYFGNQDRILEEGMLLLDMPLIATISCKNVVKMEDVLEKAMLDIDTTKLYKKKRKKRL